MTVNYNNIVFVKDRSSVIGKINRYRDRIGEGHFGSHEDVCRSQGKAVVNSGSSLNFGSNFPLVITGLPL